MMEKQYENLADNAILQFATNRGNEFLLYNVSEFSISRGVVIGVKIESPERNGISLNLGVGQGTDCDLFFDNNGTYSKKVKTQRTSMLLRDAVRSTFTVPEDKKDMPHTSI